MHGRQDTSSGQSSLLFLPLEMSGAARLLDDRTHGFDGFLQLLLRSLVVFRHDTHSISRSPNIVNTNVDLAPIKARSYGFLDVVDPVRTRTNQFKDSVHRDLRDLYVLACDLGNG